MLEYAKKLNILLRLSNLSKDPVAVHKGTVTALLQSVGSVDSEKVNVSPEPLNAVKIKNDHPEHLQSLFEGSSENLDGSQKVRLEQFLIKHQDIFFSKSPSDIGHTTLIHHHIDDQNTKLKTPYRNPLAKRRRNSWRRPMTTAEISLWSL